MACSTQFTRILLILPLPEAESADLRSPGALRDLGQLVRRPIEAMGPAEGDRYASDWERMDAGRQAAYRAMSEPAKARYADWRQGFERNTAVPSAETRAEQAADLLGSILAAAATPEGFIGYVPASVNALSIVRQLPSLARDIAEAVNSVVRSFRNRLGRNATPAELIQALRVVPQWVELLRTGKIEKGGLNLHKWGAPESTTPFGWREADRFLVLPDQGAPKPNWRQNSGRIREEMHSDDPIHDSFRRPLSGALKESDGFLEAERKLLEERGWRYDPHAGSWNPPEQ